VDPESVVELKHERSRHIAEPVSDTLNRHRPHLFGLGFASRGPGIMSFAVKPRDLETDGLFGGRTYFESSDSASNMVVCQT